MASVALNMKKKKQQQQQPRVCWLIIWNMSNSVEKKLVGMTGQSKG